MENNLHEPHFMDKNGNVQKIFTILKEWYRNATVTCIHFIYKFLKIYK